MTHKPPKNTARERPRWADEALGKPLLAGRGPVQTVASAREALGISAQTADTGIAALLELGLLREATGRRWGRSFRAHEVLAVLEGRARPAPEGTLTPTKVG